MDDKLWDRLHVKDKNKEIQWEKVNRETSQKTSKIQQRFEEIPRKRKIGEKNVQRRVAGMKTNVTKKTE